MQTSHVGCIRVAEGDRGVLRGTNAQTTWPPIDALLAAQTSCWSDVSSFAHTLVGQTTGRAGIGVPRSRACLFLSILKLVCIILIVRRGRQPLVMTTRQRGDNLFGDVPSRDHTLIDGHDQLI